MILPQQWQKLCSRLQTTVWSKIDSKDGVTVARKKFGRNTRGHAVIKVEGELPATPRSVFQFLQQSMKDGGKVRASIVSGTCIHEYVCREVTLV